MVVDSIDVPRTATVLHAGSAEVVRYDELAAKIASEWRSKGQHTNDDDHAFDQAILHTNNQTEFKYVIAVIDAIYGTRRTVSLGSKRGRSPPSTS